MAYTIATPGTSGSVLTSSGTNGVWSTLSQTSVPNSWTISASDANLVSPNSASIKLTGEHADIDINGVSLKATLAGIQERLALLTPNPELEKEWEELKALGDAYRTLEADIKAKMKTFDILKTE